MLRLPCPFCGIRDHAEFSYEGDATVVYPDLDASEADWFDATFLRDNPKGWHTEYWRHVHGCGAFLIVERNTVTHELGRVRFADPRAAAALEGQS